MGKASDKLRKVLADEQRQPMDDSDASIAAREATAIHGAFTAFIATAMCVKRRNTPEFMAHLAAAINTACEAIGCDDRVIWPGNWSNEFHYEIGADQVRRVES